MANMYTVEGMAVNQTDDVLDPLPHFLYLPLRKITNSKNRRNKPAPTEKSSRWNTRQDVEPTSLLLPTLYFPEMPVHGLEEEINA